MNRTQLCNPAGPGQATGLAGLSGGPVGCWGRYGP